MSMVTIRPAERRDIDGWMALVEQVKDIFPGLETEAALAEHRVTVLDFIQRASAVCAELDGRLVGTLLFSDELHMLCFLAVDPTVRRQHIAARMVDWMLTRMTPGADITVTTYREGQPEGVAARAFYRRLGFAEGRLTEEFGSPCRNLF